MRKPSSFIAAALLLAGVQVYAHQGPGPGRLAFSHLKGQTMTIHLSQADGKGDRVAPGIKSPLAVHPALSPDGSRLAFASLEGDDPTDSASLYSIGTDGRGTQLLAANGALPAWSPDGKQLVFTLDNTPPTIGIVNADGTGMKTLPVRRPFAVAPFWSPDGKRIAFTGAQEADPKSTDLYLMNADGSGIEPLTSGGKIFLGGAGCWSPDGSSILLYAVDTRARAGELQVWDVAKKQPRTVMAVSSALSQGGVTLTAKNCIPMACWSPDGQSIAVTLVSQKNNRSELGVFQVTLEGQILRRMTPAGVPCFGASWSR